MPGRPVAPILPGEEAVPRLEAGAGRAQRGWVLRHAGEREIADRDDVRAGVARMRMAAAVAEGIELFDIADIERGLRRHPFAQADLEGAVREGIECAGRQAGARLVAVAGDEHRRLLVLHRDDRDGQPDLDRRQLGVAHRPLLEIEPERIAFIGRKARPDCLDGGDHAPAAPEQRSASVTSRIFGCAIGEASRIARAIARLVAARVERAGGDEGARGRAADSGIAMHDERRLAVASRRRNRRAFSTCAACGAT